MGLVAGNADRQDLLYGVHPVTEALRSGSRNFLRILVVRRDRRLAEIFRLARVKQVPVFVEPRSRLDKLASQRLHQGVVGLVASKRYTDEEDLLVYAQQQSDAPFLVILDGVEDPQNLGSVLRTAEAAGVHGVFIPDRRAVGLTAGVAKASGGALEHIRVARCQNIGKFIQRLEDLNIPAYALDPQAERPYTDFDFCGPMALVLGVEGRGIRPGVLKKCEDRIRIPMFGKLDSMNLSASASVVIFEAVRQRRLAVFARHAISI